MGGRGVEVEARYHPGSATRGPLPSVHLQGPLVSAPCFPFSWDLSFGNLLYMHGVAVRGNL